MPIITNQQPNAMQQQDPQQASPQGRRQRGTGFTNIRNLLQANVGAGGVMGAGLASGLGQKAGQLSRDVQTAGQQFGQQYQQQKEKTLGQGGSVAGIGGYLTGGQDVSGLSEEEAQRLGKGLAEAQYAGPTELANQQSLLGRAGNVQALSTLAGLGGIGQGRLLQGSATRRGAYTRGQGLLDQYLVGQDVGAQQAIKAASAEAAGAAQQAQTSADVAAQQAEGLKTSIEAQKESTRQEVLKALAGTQEQATQGAKQFLAQADRIKQAITSMGGEKGINLDQLNDEDLALLRKLSEYGIDEAELTEADDLSGLLKQIAASGNVGFTGQQRYGTDAEQRAARNLALLSGQGDVAKKISETEFDPKVFTDANSKIKAQVSASKQEDERVRAETGLNINNAEEAQNAVNKFNAGSAAFNSGKRGTEWITGGDKGWFEKTLEFVTPTSIARLGDMLSGSSPEARFESVLNNANRMPEETFIKQAADLLGKDKILEIYRHGAGGEFLGATTPYRRNFTMDRIKEAYDKKLAIVNKLNERYKSRTSLQDYIDKKFNLNPPQQGS